RHRQAEERLGRVGRTVGEGRGGLAAPGAQLRLVVDEQGRAELAGQLLEVAARDGEPAALVDLGGIGKQRQREGAGHGGAHIESGANAPTWLSPAASLRRAASTSHSRACVSSGATPSPIT